MRVRVYDKQSGICFQSEVYAIINTGYYEKYLVSVPFGNGGYMKLFDYLDKSDQKLPVLVNLVTPQGPEGWIYKQTGKVDRQFEEYRHVLGPSILFFEYRGFPWLWEDTDTLGALLRGESVLIRGSLFEDRLYSDTALPGWNYVFSDSCLEKPDTSYEGTWITAYGLRWRFT